MGVEVKSKPSHLNGGQTPRSCATPHSHIMEKLIFPSALALAAFLLAGCGKREPVVSNPPIVPLPAAQAKNLAANAAKISAEKNSYAEVAPHLDLGGQFYLYLTTEQLIPRIEEMLKMYSEIGMQTIKASGNSTEEATIGLKIVPQFLLDSGLRDISGFGASSFALEKGFYGNSGILHHYADRGQGGFWKLLGGQVHEQGVLKLLPVSTALVSHGDLDALRVYDWIKRLAKEHGDSPWAAEFNKSMDQAEKMFALEKTLRSFGGEVGLAITIHPERTISLPGGIKLPEPGLMLFVKTKDNTFQKLLASTTQAFEPKIEKVGNTTITYHDIPLPAEVPLKLGASYFQAGDYLVLTSTVELAKEVLAVQAGGKGLAGTDEFRKLAKDMDLKGNQIHFVNRRVNEAMINIQKIAMASMPDEAPRRLMEKMLGTNEIVSGLVVIRCLPEGVL